VQVREETILAALSRPFAIQQRRLRFPGHSSVTETVVAARASHLVPALVERVRRSHVALLDL
jgi:hypothetical protein